MNWKPEWSRVRVRVSRKTRNARGWNVYIAGGVVWVGTKGEAVAAVRKAIRALSFEIRPVTRKEVDRGHDH